MKYSDFAGRHGLRLLGWHQQLQHFVARFTFGKISLTQLKPRAKHFPVDRPALLLAAGAHLVDKDSSIALGLELSAQLVDVTLTSADAPQGDDFAVSILSSVGHRDGFFMNIRPT